MGPILFYRISAYYQLRIDKVALIPRLVGESKEYCNLRSSLSLDSSFFHLSTSVTPPCCRLRSLNSHRFWILFVTGWLEEIRLTYYTYMISTWSVLFIMGANQSQESANRFVLPPAAAAFDKYSSNPVYERGSNLTLRWLTNFKIFSLQFRQDLVNGSGSVYALEGRLSNIYTITLTACSCLSRCSDNGQQNLQVDRWLESIQPQSTGGLPCSIGERSWWQSSYR